MTFRRNLFLPLILTIAFLLRLPSLFEPNWYGDEGIYQVIGQALASGRLLYTGIWDNKPPLLYIVYAIFNGDQFAVRFASLLVMVFTIIVFYFLAKKLLVNKKIVYGTTGLFALLFATPLLEGNIANAENFMLLPILCAIYLVLENENGFKNYFFSGILLAIAFLTKIVAIFDLATLLTLLFILSIPKDTKRFLQDCFFLCLGFLLPVLATVLFFVAKGAFFDFFTATFSQNVNYVGAGNNLFIGQGLLLLKLFLLGTVCFILLLRRKVFSKEQIFIYLWFGFSLFNAFFGGRPWIHYLLTFLPAFCFFIGLAALDKKRRILHLVLCGIVLTLLYKNFWIYGKTLSYYGNFFAFMSGTKTVLAYNEFFDWFVNRDYELAFYIRQHTRPNDTVFIWGDNAQIYALSKRLPPGRYAVSYHVTFYPHALLETKKAIENEKPIFILAVRDDFPDEFLDNTYVLKTTIEGVKVYARRS